MPVNSLSYTLHLREAELSIVNVKIQFLLNSEISSSQVLTLVEAIKE
jgi:hypothetical protein